jgi:hypothetical protein
VQQPGWNAAAIKELAITWHPTTPRNFECQPGCLCCCVATLFFPSEAEKCPVEIQNGLEWRQGFIRAGRRPSGICMFFDEDASQHCTIFGHRPLRCRLYPYLPLITNEGIVIIADPLFTVSLPESDLPTWYRCYGLGCGPNVEAPIAQMSRDFLIHVADEYPQLMDTLCVDDVEHYLNRKEIDKNLHPMFPNWDRDLVRRQAGDW